MLLVRYEILIFANFTTRHTNTVKIAYPINPESKKMLIKSNNKLIIFKRGSKQCINEFIGKYLS